MKPDASSIVSVRVSPSERHFLETAAEHSRTTLSDFIRRTAIHAAEADVLNHRSVTIPADEREQFEAWVHAPAKDVPALRPLAATPPAWRE